MESGALEMKTKKFSQGTESKPNWKTSPSVQQNFGIRKDHSLGLCDSYSFSS